MSLVGEKGLDRVTNALRPFPSTRELSVYYPSLQRKPSLAIDFLSKISPFRNFDINHYDLRDICRQFQEFAFNDRTRSKGSLRSKIDKRDAFLRAGDVHRVETTGFTRGRGNGGAEIKQKNRHPRALARGVVRPRVRDERAIFSNYLVPRAGIANRIC